MSDNSENSTFGNFSIEDTMEMGMGNKELLEGLFSPETATAKPEDVESIEEANKKAEKLKKEAAEKAKKVPEKKTIKEEERKKDEEGEKEDPLEALFGKEEETPTDKKKEEGKENEEEEEEEEEDQPVNDNKFSALSKDLFKLGVFSKEEGEEDVDISSPEAFLERFNIEKQKGAIEVVDKFIGQFGEDYQNAFDAIFVKGVNPKEYFSTYNNISDFSSLDLTVEANQVSVIKQTLSNQGMEPDEITAEIERYKNYGDLETVAQRYHKVLVKNEAAKLAQMEKESEQRLQQQAAVKTQYIKNVQSVLQDKLKNKEFDGIPINPKLAVELQDFLVTDKYKTPSGETLTEFDRTILDLKRPENHEKKVKVALLLKILEKDPTLSTIQKAGVSKKSEALFGELARHSGKTTVKEQKTSKPTSWFVNS